MTIAIHSPGMAAFPAYPKERLIPSFPPSWANVFGEDDQGIFAKLDRFDFEFRWIMPQLLKVQVDAPASKFVEGFWLAEKAIAREAGKWRTDAVHQFIESCAIAHSCPVRLPTHTELLAARQTLGLVERERYIAVPEGQLEICLNDSRPLGLNSSIINDILVDTLSLKIIEATEAENTSPFLRLAIQAS